MSMTVTLDNGAIVEVEVDMRLGFTVHDPDGSAYQRVHFCNPRIIRVIREPTPPPGGGEPLPETQVA